MKAVQGLDSSNHFPFSKYFRDPTPEGGAHSGRRVMDLFSMSAEFLAITSSL